MKYEAVVMGASVGGLDVLRKILSTLPSNFPLAMLIVQHRPPSEEELFTLSLNEVCQLTVKEADEKEVIKPGVVYIAPANYHLLVERDKTISLSIDPKIRYSRPSIDVLFETAAEAYLSHLIGIILTGANHDGTSGIKKIKEEGGFTIAQTPKTAQSDIMPRTAIEANVINKILSPLEIAMFLSELQKRKYTNENNIS